MTATLTWGVKESFRNYVEGSGGETAAGAGADRAADGTFTFAATPDAVLTLNAEGRPEGQGQFLGEVQFKAHGGMLSVFFADPRVEIGPEGAVISVADTPKRDYRMAIAKLDMAAATSSGDEWSIPATITLDGYQLLGGHYPPGTPIDPVRLKLAT